MASDAFGGVICGRLLAQSHAEGDAIQHSFWLFDMEVNARTAEARFNVWGAQTRPLLESPRFAARTRQPLDWTPGSQAPIDRREMALRAAA